MLSKAAPQLTKSNELIYERADAQKAHMELTNRENAPDGKIVKADISIAQNYLI